MTPEQVQEIESFWPWLRTVAASMTTEDRAEDLAQDGWLAMWRGAEKWSGTGNFHGWIRRCAKNGMLTSVRDSKWAHNDLRKTVLTGDFPEDIEPVAPAVHPELDYHTREILEALNDLPEKHREYIVLKFWGGWRRSELDAHFNSSNSARMWQTAKPKLARALAHLKDAV